MHTYLSMSSFLVLFLYFSNHNTDAHSNPAVVPLIVVTNDETSRTRCKQNSSSRVDKAAKSSYPSILPINMDNISLKDYSISSSCPGSPTLPDKTSPTTCSPATLSPPLGVPPTPTSNTTGTGKRRGIGHRASYKRAHKGRVVNI